jgi:hypothetical protein
MVSVNQKESVANKYPIRLLKSVLNNYTEKKCIQREKNPNWKDGLGDQSIRLRVNGEKVRRSHIVWRINHKKKIPIGYHIHHKNENKHDDSISNLQLVKAPEHAIWNLRNGS